MPNWGMLNPMTLENYLKSVGKSPEKFGAEIGVYGSTIRRYIYGERFPRTAVLQKIIKATKGRVTADDFLASAEAA